MQVSGLTSGIDTESLISQLVQLKSEPITRYQTEQDAINTQKDAWSDIKSKISDLLSGTDTLQTTSLWDAMAATYSVDNVVSATVSSGAANGVYDINVTQLAKAESDASADAATLGVADANSDLIAAGVINAVGDTFDINGKTVTLTDAGGGTVTLNSIANDINNTAGTGVTASIVADTLVITADNTGTANAITYGADPNSDLLNLDVANAGVPQHQNQAPLDAQFTVNGLSVTRSSNDNLTDVISGVTLNLLAESSTKMTVGTDTQTIKEDINSFVEKFNAAMTDIYGYIGDGGTLQGDMLPDSILGAMRDRVTDYVQGLGTYTVLDQVGITITGNTMTFDESKFDQAYADNPTEVKSLFTNTSATYQEQGAMVKLYNYLNDLTTGDGVFDTKTSSLDDTYDEIQTQIDNYQKYLDSYADRLRKQFQDMEAALSSLNQQGSYLSGLVSSMGG